MKNIILHLTYEGKLCSASRVLLFAVYDQALEYFEQNGGRLNQPVHIINMDIQDNHEEATIGAFLLCELVQTLADSEDMEDEIDEIVQRFEAKHHRSILHHVVFY